MTPDYTHFVFLTGEEAEHDLYIKDEYGGFIAINDTHSKLIDDFVHDVRQEAVDKVFKTLEERLFKE